MNTKILTDHFSWEEVTHSYIALRCGIDNTIIPDSIIPAVFNTAKYMETVRDTLGGKVIHVNSWYRCLELNRALKSKDHSQHVKGESVDFICSDFGSPIDICKAVIKARIYFDQLILEHTWVHISFQSNPNIDSRNEVLTLLPDTGHYAKGITNIYGKPLCTKT